MEGTTYNYGIYALDYNNNYSNVIQISQTPLDTTPPDNPSSLQTTAGIEKITLAWANPSDSDFEKVALRYSTSGPIESKTSGTLIYSGPNQTFLHTPQSTSTTHYYGLFAIDDNNNYSSAEKTIAKTTKLNWSYLTTFQHEITSSPTIGPDGTIYVGSTDRKVYAINANGTLKWTFQSNAEIYSSPAVDSNNTIYVGASQDFYAINQDGSLKWSQDYFNTKPKLIANSTIYIWESGDLKALNLDGSLKWTYEANAAWTLSSPLVGPDGIIYIGSTSYDKLFAITPDGNLKWLNADLELGKSSPAIGPDGTLYVGSDWINKKLYAINSNGNLKWSYQTNGEPTTATIGSDNTIYFGSRNKLIALNSNGTLKWTYQANDFVNSTPGIGSDGTIYIGTSDKLYAINPDGSIKWSYKSENRLYNRSSQGGPIIHTNGTIYIASEDGILYAFEE